MITASDIGWGRYREFEGPFFRGAHPYRISANPDALDRIIAVTAATEGGHWDALNMYDRCIVTLGLTQFCEGAYYCVSKMLTSIASADLELLTPLIEHAASVGDLYAWSRGRWRFFIDGVAEVNTLDEQQHLFLRCDGHRGSWSAAAQHHAKAWGAAFCNIWDNPWARRLQAIYNAEHIQAFALPYAKKLRAGAPDTSVAKAWWAGYLSFAVNNPARAHHHLQRAVATAKTPMWSAAWLVEVLKELTFGPKITIYPHRYNAIRPVLESLYGVELPDLADELERWQSENGFLTMLDTDEVQKALIALGSDLGPAGADGKYGPKTRDAVLTFEQLSGVPERFQDGMVDEYTYPALEAALQAKGLSTLSA